MRRRGFPDPETEERCHRCAVEPVARVDEGAGGASGEGFKGQHGFVRGGYGADGVDVQVAA